MRNVNKIIVHCSDTPAEMDIGAKEITVWHTSPPPTGNGWKAIGYAYIIRRDGMMELGRDLDGDGDVVEEIGAHAAGFNSHSIGVCMVGRDSFTDDQFRMLRWLCNELTSIHQEAEVLGHRDLPGVKKSCPGFDVKSWWEA
jgi:hypothetical protein